MSTAIDHDRPADGDEREQAAQVQAEAVETGAGSESDSPPLYGASTGRSFRCPCCLSLAADSDYHHWSYPRDDGVDVGLRLCRDCHSAVHGDRRVAVQRRRSPTGDWRDDALARLIARHRAVWGYEPPGGFTTWYNIPVSRERVLRAIPRSLDPRVVEAATPDSDDSGGSGSSGDTDHDGPVGFHQHPHP